MQIRDAFRITSGDRVALIGSGGKTSTLIRLAESFARGVVLTTTTHVDPHPFLSVFRHYIVRTQEDYALAMRELSSACVLLTGDSLDSIRYEAPREEILATLYRDVLAQRLTLLVEADGSRQLPLKAPKDSEPHIPSLCNQVILCVGMSGIGKPLTAETVHRPEIYTRLSGLDPGEIVTPQAAMRVLTHPSGELRALPPGAEATLLLNQADSEAVQSTAGQMAAEGVRSGLFVRAVVAALGYQNPQPHIFARVEPVAGIILAAGGSTRFGQPKQLLPVEGQPMVYRAAKAALAAGLDPVMVVIGAAGDQVRAVLQDLPVRIVVNPDWELGQSTSVLAGLRALPLRTGAAIFQLADQPFVDDRLVSALVERWQTSGAPVVAPLIADRRANPVLFDRSTFPEFASLSGDQGARTILPKFKVEYLPWQDERAARDIDTMEDYVRFKRD